MTKGNITYRTKDGREFPVSFRWDDAAGWYVAVVDGADVEIIIDREPTKEDFVRLYNTSVEAMPPGQRLRIPNDQDQAQDQETEIG